MIRISSLHAVLSNVSSRRKRLAAPAAMATAAALLAVGCSDPEETAPSGTAGVPTGAAGSSAMAGASAIGAAGSEMGLTSEPCPAEAVYCDDFEDDAVGQRPAPPWAVSVRGNGSMAIDATRALSGSNAALASIPAGSGYERAYMGLDPNSEAVPGLSTDMYGRAMMWLDATPTTSDPNNTVHWTFVEGEGVSPDMPGSNRLYRYGGQQQGGAGLMANYDTTGGVATDCWDHSASTMPTAQWTCVEWHFATETNEMEFWLNGAKLEDIHVTDEGEGCIGSDLNNQWLAPPEFQVLWLGWERYQVPTNDRNLWIDDVALSAQRVGCPAVPAP